MTDALDTLRDAGHPVAGASHAAHDPLGYVMSVFTNPASSSKEQGKVYTAAILDLLGDRKPLDVLGHTESELRKRIDGLTPKQLAQHEAPGKWSIAQVLQHLADSDL